jgi:hypothetical protein
MELILRVIARCYIPALTRSASVTSPVPVVGFVTSGPFLIACLWALRSACDVLNWVGK